MSKRITVIVSAVAVCAIFTIGLVVASRYRMVEVQSGTIVQCLDPRHAGETVMQSSIKTLHVHSKDSRKYGVAVDSLVCAKCQARVKVEAQEARARRQKEDIFIAALRKHDDAVLLNCRRIAGIVRADPATFSLRSVRRDISQLRSLALSGKQLCAPESLAQVESKYGKSMDELLTSLTHIEAVLRRGSRDTDVALLAAELHMLRSKQYRDEAIVGLARR